MVGCTIAIAHNRPKCNLRLTQKQVADFCLGKINNCKELQLRQRSARSLVVHRSDGSGTTKAFSLSLSSFSSEVS